MTTNSAKAKRANARQREVTAYLVAAGYTLAHAQQVARMWHPTPAQKNLQVARTKRRDRQRV